MSLVEITNNNYCHFSKDAKLFIINCEDYGFSEHNLPDNVEDTLSEDDILNFIHHMVREPFQTIKDMSYEDNKRYIEIMCTLNVTSYNEHFVKFLGKLLQNIKNQQEKGRLAENAFFDLSKKTLPSLRYSGNVNYSADFNDISVFLFEIKNCKTYRSVHFEKLCRDMIEYFNNHKIFKIGILVHFYNDNFYDINKNTIENVFDLSNLTAPFIAIPFYKSFHCYEEILDSIKTTLTRHCCFSGFEQIRKKAEDFIQHWSNKRAKREKEQLKIYDNFHASHLREVENREETHISRIREAESREETHISQIREEDNRDETHISRIHELESNEKTHISRIRELESKVESLTVQLAESNDYIKVLLNKLVTAGIPIE